MSFCLEVVKYTPNLNSFGVYDPILICKSLSFMHKKQIEVLLFIGDYFNEHGRTPSYREIGAKIRSVSNSVVAYHVKKLVAAGMVEQTPHVARSLVVRQRGLQFILQHKRDDHGA